MANDAQLSADGLSRDLLLHCGRYIPDPMLDEEARIARIEAYLVSASEELENLLPMLYRIRMTDAPAALVPETAPETGA